MLPTEKQAIQFNWDFAKWQEQGILKIVHIDFKKPIEMKMLAGILQLIENDHYDRLVIDSINPIAHAPPAISSVDHRLSMPDRDILSEMIRANIITLFDKTTKNGVTTVCIAQKDEKDPTNKMLDYIGDGLIDFEASAVGENENRTIQFKKLRWTKTNILQHPFNFTDNGISLI